MSILRRIDHGTALANAAILAAIMSTVDSLLILASSAVVRDYWQQVRGTGLSDAALANRGKIVTVLIGLAGIGFALHQTPLIFWFVLFAWSGLGAAFGPCRRPDQSLGGG